MRWEIVPILHKPQMAGKEGRSRAGAGVPCGVNNLATVPVANNPESLPGFAFVSSRQAYCTELDYAVCYNTRSSWFGLVPSPVESSHREILDNLQRVGTASTSVISMPATEHARMNAPGSPEGRTLSLPSRNRIPSPAVVKAVQRDERGSGGVDWMDRNGAEQMSVSSGEGGRQDLHSHLRTG